MCLPCPNLLVFVNSVLLLEKGFGEFRLLTAVVATQRSRKEVNSLVMVRYKLRQDIRALVDQLGPSYATSLFI